MGNEVGPLPEDISGEPRGEVTDNNPKGLEQQQADTETGKGAEFHFDEVKRPFTIDDVKEFQRQFKAFEERRKAEGADWTIGANQFYLYLSSGSFYGVEKPNGEKPETLTEEGRQGYNDLLLTFYKDWRENLIKNKDHIAQTRPEVTRQLGDLNRLPDAQTAKQVRELYDKYPLLNDFSAAQYQEGLDSGVVNNPFLHFTGHRRSGYKYDRPKAEVRLYLNPPINNVPKLAQEFARRADERGIQYYFKLVDFALQEPFPEDLKRVDRMVFFADSASAPKITGVLAELKEEHPEWFTNRPLPPLTAKIMDGVGAAEEPSKYQNEKFASGGKKRTSFNEVRSELLREVWLDTVKNIVLHNPNLKLEDGRSLRQIFDNLWPAEDQHQLDALWENNLNPLSKDSKAKWALDRTLARTMAEIVPQFNAETLLPWVNQQIGRLAPKYHIDPDNLAFNKAA